jgi:hypothetical protein
LDGNEPTSADEEPLKVLCHKPASRRASKTGGKALSAIRGFKLYTK